MRAVLFDVDGTLVKAGGAGRRALNRAVYRLYGFADVCSTFSLAGRMDLDNFRLAFLNAVRRKPAAEELARIEAAYLELLPGEVDRAVRLGTYAEVPGASKLVRALSRRRDVLVGLGTGNVEEGARIKLGPSGLLKYFRFGGFGTDGPSRAHMLKTAVRRAEALARRKIKPPHVCAIGDTPRDVRAGRKAGLRTGAVTDGFGDEKAVRRMRPDFLARDFSEVQDWLRWIAG